MEGSEEVIVRDILRQSLNGSSDCSPLSRVMAPLTWRRREREEPMAASTLEGRNTMSEGDTTNTCSREKQTTFNFNTHAPLENWFWLNRCTELKKLVNMCKVACNFTMYCSIRTLEPLTTHPDEWAEPSHK